MALHRTGQTHAECLQCLHRELQWAIEGRTPERDAVHVAGPGSHYPWILAGRPQPLPPPFPTPGGGALSVSPPPPPPPATSAALFPSAPPQTPPPSPPQTHP